MLTYSEMRVLALRSLAVDAEPVGMLDTTDAEERERLAVALIRSIKADADMMPEWNRAFQVHNENLDTEIWLENMVSALSGSYRFFRSRSVNVNGKTLKLKYIA